MIYLYFARKTETGAAIIETWKHNQSDAFHMLLHSGLKSDGTFHVFMIHQFIKELQHH